MAGRDSGGEKPARERTAAKMPTLVPSPVGGMRLTGGMPGNKGGGNPRGANSMTHGLTAPQYTQNERMQALISKHAENPNPLDMLDDLAKGRALFEDWMDRAEAFSEALLAWHESYDSRGRPLSQAKMLALESVLDEYESLLDQRGEATEKQEEDLKSARELMKALSMPKDDAKPRKVMDIADGHKILLTIAKIVDGINRKDANLFISRKVFLNVMGRMGLVAKMVLERWHGRTLDAEKAGEQLETQWGQIPMV